MSPALGIVASNVGFYTANGVTMVFLAVLMSAHGLTDAEIGTTLGLSYLVRVVAAPIWGQLADRLGRIRTVMAVCCIVSALPILVLLNVQGFWPVMSLVLLGTAGTSALNPLSDTIAWRSAERFGFSFGPVRAAGSVCFVLGNLGGGVVAQALGSTSIAWMIAGLTMLTFVLLPLMPNLRLPKPEKRAKLFGPLMAIAPYRRLLLISALVQGAHAAFYGLSTLYWRSAGISDRMIGVLWAEGVTAEIIVMVLLRHRITRINPYLLMRIGACGAIVRWVCMGLTTDPLLLVLIQPLHAMSFTLSYLAALRIIAEVTPRYLAATAQTVYAALGYSGPTGVMIALVSWLYPSWGGNVFFLMAAMVVLALPLLWPRDRVLSL